MEQEIDKLIIEIEAKTNTAKKQITDIKNVVDKTGKSYIALETTINKYTKGYDKVTTAYQKNGEVAKQTITSVDSLGNKVTTVDNKMINAAKTGSESWMTSLTKLTAKLTILGYGLKKVWSTLGGFIAESNSYVENLNLFRVTFGELADEAQNFVNTFSEALGLDPSEVMRNMGFFNQIATGFGLANDKAYQMSQTLTQISYDLSSFLNIEISDAIQKVQSGLSGELEPLRRVGYALDEATLQQIAYNHGITESVRLMTQAEKAQIRTIAIYEQSANVMGDLAGTITSPANQLRILNQQITLFKRAIGNTMIPLMNALLPYINGITQGLTALATAFANILGFEVVGAREGAVTEYLDNITDSAIEAEEALKGSLLPFDKFISLSSADTDTGADVGSTLDLDIPTYDALLGLEDISNKTKEIADTVKGWFVTTDAEGNINGLSSAIKGLLGLLTTLTTIKIVSFFKEFITKLDGTTASTKALTLASKLLSTTGIFLISYAIIDLITNFKNLDDITKAVDTAFILLGATLLILSNKTILTAVIGALKALPAYIMTTVIPAIKAFSSSALFLNIALGSTAGILSFLIFDSILSGLGDDARAIVAPIMLAVGAIGALAISLLALKGIMSWGVGIPLILASVGMGVAGLKSMIEPQAFATGGFTPETKGSLFIAGEAGQELMGDVGGKNAVANVNSIESAMENSSYRGMLKALSEFKTSSGSTSGDVVIRIDGKELARTQVINNANALSSKYRISFEPR